MPGGEGMHAMRAALACGLGAVLAALTWAQEVEAGNTTGRTGRGAVALPGVYCQQWPSQGTGTQTPCGPNFQTQPTAPPSGAQQQAPQESEAEQRLMNLTLSFAHIALAVEIQGPDEEKHAKLRAHMKIVRSTADAVS